MKAVFFAVCLVLATSAEVPVGDRKLQRVAIAILAQTEIRGGELLNKLLIERSFRKGDKAHTSDSEVLTEARVFLQELLSAVTTFNDMVHYIKEDTAASPIITILDHHHRGTPPTPTPRTRTRTRRREEPSHYPTFPSLELPFPLPPGVDLEDLEGLDYNEILDILGEYTKGFIQALLPRHPLLGDREALLAQFNALVDSLLEEIRKTASI